jgi:hypothetical protein
MQSGGQDLVQQLHAAFPAERIRGDAAFAQWGGSYPDAVAFKQVIDGKTWEELDARYIVKRDDALGFLSTRELVQLLPVYLRAVLEDAWSPASYAVLVKLIRPASEPSRGRFEAFIQALTPGQSKWRYRPRCGACTSHRAYKARSVPRCAGSAP